MQSKNSSQTEMNLLQAFAGESQANRKYLAFAKQAEKEGYPQAARLFRAAAEAETVHALAHLRALGNIGTTEENLKAALAGETFEFTEMYPPMIRQAEEEGHDAARRSFAYANSVEIQHALLYQQALDQMGALKETDYYVCSVCGHTCADGPPDACPVCGSTAGVFSKTD
ncbi:MAG: rubrerythrin family protein [Syntrophobacteraceae bacterium]|jgi:rubrerythrin